jgi:hypothetical protein
MRTFTSLLIGWMCFMPPALAAEPVADPWAQQLELADKVARLQLYQAQAFSPGLTFALNLPGPIGYATLGEWGWFAGLLAVDALSLTALVLDLNGQLPHGRWMGATGLVGTRVFGSIHGPLLAHQYNERLRLQLGLRPQDLAAFELRF